MPHLVRTWTGLAAIGAGLIHLGVAAHSSPFALLLLVLVGAAEVLWGAAALAWPAPPLPRVALAGALGVLAVWIASLLLSAGPHPGHSGHGPHAGAIATAGGALLDLAVAAGLAVALRRGPRGQELRPWPMVAGTAAGALVVAAIVGGALGTVFPGGHAH